MGVYNEDLEADSSYSIVSRSIGEENSGADIIVDDLEFSGGEAHVTLDPRQAKYYKVNIEEDKFHSWQVRLNKTLRTSSMAIRKEYIPTFYASESGDSSMNGILMDKKTPEFYSLIPDSGERFIKGGTYYISVIGQGANSRADNVGLGISESELISIGESQLIDLGGLDKLKNEASDNFQSFSSELKVYKFELLETFDLVSIFVKDYSGRPIFSARNNDLIPGFLPQQSLAYGFDFDPNDSGYIYGQYNSPIYFYDAQPGKYTISLSASADLSSMAAGELVVEAFDITPLAFDKQTEIIPNYSHVVTGSVGENLKDFYKVIVPESISSSSGAPGMDPIGWKLNLNAVTGDFRIHVDGFFTKVEGYTIYRKPYFMVLDELQPGEEIFIEVEGAQHGDNHYELVSSAVIPLESWIMPEEHNTLFGDSGLRELRFGDWDFYSIEIPIKNKGLLKVELEEASEEVQFFLRRKGIPTIFHLSNGVTLGGNFSYSSSSENGLHCNWAVDNRRETSRLEAGQWFIGVRAVEADTLYQLKISTGSVMSLTPTVEGVVFSNQIVKKNDILYYKYEAPDISSDDSPPTEWNIGFTEHSGDVELFIREGSPPGFTYSSKIANLISDNQNEFEEWPSNNGGIDVSGDYTFRFPKLRPGSDYYIGVHGKVDSVFELKSSINNVKLTDPVGISSDIATYGEILDIDFFGGSRTFRLNPGEHSCFRVKVPPGATRFKATRTPLFATPSQYDVDWYIEQGTPPHLTWKNHGNMKNRESSFERDFGLDRWPWIAGEDYYLLFVNQSHNILITEISIEGEGFERVYDEWTNEYELDESKSDLSYINNSARIANIVSYAYGFNPFKNLLENGVDQNIGLSIKNQDVKWFELETLMPNDSPDEIVYTIEMASSLNGEWIKVFEKLGDGDWVGGIGAVDIAWETTLKKQRLYLKKTDNGLSNNFFRLRMGIDTN